MSITKINEVRFRRHGQTQARRAVDAAVYAKTGGRCWYCGTQTSLPPCPTPARMSIDHLMPRILGGGDDLANLVPACRQCNCAKGGRTVEGFRLQQFYGQHDIEPFSDRQLAWLAAHGVRPLDMPRPRFWFEVMGVTP